jgi:hypothetical protein
MLLGLRQPSQGMHDSKVIQLVHLIDRLSGGQLTHHTAASYRGGAPEDVVLDLGKEITLRPDPDLEVVAALGVTHGTHAVGIVYLACVADCMRFAVAATGACAGTAGTSRKGTARSAPALPCRQGQFHPLQA